MNFLHILYNYFATKKVKNEAQSKFKALYSFVLVENDQATNASQHSTGLTKGVPTRREAEQEGPIQAWQCDQKGGSYSLTDGKRPVAWD